MKRFAAPLLLTALFALLTALALPSGCVYGSSTDWLSQHAALAETIRDACLEQKALLPDFLPLGGGSNGFQFSYYGYLRPDILIGCLLPSVPMYQILIFYALAGYLASVLLFYLWLRREQLARPDAFWGSLLFLTASCFFHTHRQLMFVNYMPFLLLALLSIQRQPRRMPPMLPFFLLLICLHSFYYAPACFLAAGWYWIKKSGKGFLRPWLASSALAACMSAALLLPTGLAILEHRRASAEAGSGLLTFFGNLSSLLYSPYGLGLSLLILYLLVLGLSLKKYRADSLIFLILLFWGGASYLLNATLYARAKILIPFLPLLLLHAAGLLADLRRQKAGWRLWPLLPVLAVAVLYLNRSYGRMVLADLLILSVAAALLRLPAGKREAGALRRSLSKAAFSLLFVMPVLFFLRSASTEDFVTREELASALAEPEYMPGSASLNEPEDISGDVSRTLYRYDSLMQPLAKSNRDVSCGRNKSTMYSSVYSGAYSQVYYDFLKTPIRINNRLAFLAANHPFLLHFMGIRYVETKPEEIPDGYHLLWKNETTAVSENEQVLPMAYVTDRTMPDAQFETLAGWEQAEALMQYAVTPDSPSADWESRIRDFSPALSTGTLPSSLSISENADPSGRRSFELAVSEDTLLTLSLREPLKDSLLLLDFQVENHTGSAVSITINGVKNKLSAPDAPYPNGNSRFHYAFSSADTELGTLEISLSKGRYTLGDIRFSLLDASVLSDRSVTPASAITAAPGEILACRVEAKKDQWFITSIPLQNGMAFLVDGSRVPPSRVNTAFAGIPLSAGEHEIRLCFRAPGKRLGCLLSLGGVICQAALCISEACRRKKAKALTSGSEPR